MTSADTETEETDEDDSSGLTILAIVLGVVVGIPLLLVVIAVVGIVILMVLGIGSAILGSFVLGMGEGVEEAAEPPRVEFEGSYDGSSATITHVGGEAVDADRLELVVDGRVHGTWAESGGDAGDVEAGDSVTIPNVESSDTVRVVWTDEEGRPATLYAAIASEMDDA